LFAIRLRLVTKLGLACNAFPEIRLLPEWIVIAFKTIRHPPFGIADIPYVQSGCLLYQAFGIKTLPSSSHRAKTGTINPMYSYRSDTFPMRLQL
jgi:hypothetical protein